MAQMPFDVQGEHAQEDVRADAVLEAVVNRADLQLGALERAKVALDLFELLVSAHHVGRVEPFGGDGGAQDVDAVQGGLLGDSCVLALEVEVAV
jgi:hypothetical protein